MTGLEFEGKTVKDAIENACSQLHISARELKYDVISNGSTGIFGFVGVKKAKIRVLNAPNTGTASSSNQHGTDAPPDSATMTTTREVISLVDEAFQNTRDNIQTKKESSLEKRPKSYAKKRFQGSHGAARKASVSVAPTVASPVHQPDAADAQPPEALPFEQDDPSMDRLAADTSDITISVDPPPSHVESLQDPNYLELGQIGINALQKIMDHLTDGVTIGLEQQPDRILYRVEGGNSSVLIGKRGQNLEAIQYLIDKIVNKNTTKHIRIQIDVAGYTEKRKENLIKMAERMAQKTIRTGKPSTVGPMNAQDRRTVHIALKTVRGVRTQSIGEGYYRKLMIFPKQQPNRKREAADRNETGTENE
ncbi:MAG: RNA-binding cell elongation regulator Jag/EloR [Thermodesulfobacteriota bacterium]